MEVQKHIDLLKSCAWSGRIVEDKVILTRSTGCGRFSHTIKVVEGNGVAPCKDEMSLDFVKKLSTSLGGNHRADGSKAIVNCGCDHNLVVVDTHEIPGGYHL